MLKNNLDPNLYYDNEYIEDVKVALEEIITSMFEKNEFERSKYRELIEKVKKYIQEDKEREKARKARIRKK